MFRRFPWYENDYPRLKWCVRPDERQLSLIGNGLALALRANTEGEFGSANLLIRRLRAASGCRATSNVWEAFLHDASAPCRGSARLDVWK
jgi:hypothetical protein